MVSEDITQQWATSDADRSNHLPLKAKGHHGITDKIQLTYIYIHFTFVYSSFSDRYHNTYIGIDCSILIY